MTQLAPLSPTERTSLGRQKHRGVTDRAMLFSVLDEALICHLGVVRDGAPLVLPTGYGREGDTLYLHGSTGANSLRMASAGIDVCVTVTLLDGIVYARSIFNHSMNYRSAVIIGSAKAVEEPGAKMHALQVITDHLAPGSWEHARDVNAKEFASTSVLAVDLAEASVKMRAKGPDDPEDEIAANESWAGVLPIRTVFGEPESSTDLIAEFPVPAHIIARAASAR